MAPVAVVTDSSACLPADLVAALGISVVPLRFVIDGKLYLDGVDITAGDFYRMLSQTRALPTTSAPSPSDYHVAIDSVAATCKAVVIITVTRRFSGMYQSAILAAAKAQESLNDVRVEVIDSATAAGAEGLVVLNAARAASRDCSLEDVCTAARQVMERVDLIATLGTLYHLARSGRVPMAAHWVNSMVHVFPLFRISPLSGEARTVRVARGRASAVRQMLELVQQRVEGRELRGTVFHSYDLGEAERLRDAVASTFKCAELYLSDFTPAMGIHTGPGVLGLAYYASE